MFLKAKAFENKNGKTMSTTIIIQAGLLKSQMRAVHIAHTRYTLAKQKAFGKHY